MRKLFYNLLFFSIILGIASCSSNDDTNEEKMQDPTEKGHFSLTLNGDGFSDQRLELFRDTINNYTWGRTIFSSSDNSSNYFHILMAQGFEAGSHSIQAYGEKTPNVIVLNMDNKGMYHSESGSITFESIITDTNTGCQFFKGTFDVDFLHETSSEPLNINGEFDVTYYSCE